MKGVGFLRITELRERAGLTQTQVADSLGLDRSAVCKWENGVSKPRADSLLKLADLFHCTIDELYGREPPNQVSA